MKWKRLRRVRSFDALRGFMLLLHLGIVAYVCWGWQAESRVALLVYTLFLPLVMMQWLFNRGVSFVANIESLIRTGRWRHPENPFEGRLFQRVVQFAGFDLSQAQICTLLVLTMAMFWMVAMFRMVVAT